jgi:D-citramalate synthase
VTVSEAKPEQWSSPGTFHVSPANFAEEVRDSLDFPARVVIHEGTLRKIEHASGAPVIQPEDKVEIARLLDAAGVVEIGANPGQYSETIKGDSEMEGVEAVCKAGLSLHVRVSDHDFRWITGDYSNFDRYADMGVYGVDLQIGSQATDRIWAAGASVDRVTEAVANALEYLRKKGLDTGVMIADIGRIDLDQTVLKMNQWLDFGAERFHLVDSLCTLSPEATRYLVRQIRTGLRRPVPTPYHVHNDFGLATACAIAAASSGAWPETSVNGFADRGFASLEEVVVALELMYGVDTGIRLEKLSELSETVAAITKCPNHPNKPITGEAVWAVQFTNQYKEVLAGKDAIDAYISSYNPALVGTAMSMNWSANTLSEEGVKAKLSQMDIAHTREDVVEIIAAVQKRLSAMKSFPIWLSDTEMDGIITEHFSNSVGS